MTRPPLIVEQDNVNAHRPRGIVLFIQLPPAQIPVQLVGKFPKQNEHLSPDSDEHDATEPLSTKTIEHTFARESISTLP